MTNLKKLLSDPAKAKRQRRINLNIQITILSWLVEFFSFFVIFLGAFILGNKNSKVTLAMQTLTSFLYFVVVPSMYLVNSKKFKAVVLESKIYSAFNVLCCFPSNEVPEDENNDTNEHREQREIALVREEDVESQRAKEDSGNTATECHSDDLEPSTQSQNHGNMNLFNQDSNSHKGEAIKKMTENEESASTSKECVITDLEDEK